MSFIDQMYNIFYLQNRVRFDIVNWFVLATVLILMFPEIRAAESAFVGYSAWFAVFLLYLIPKSFFRLRKLKKGENVYPEKLKEATEAYALFTPYAWLVVNVIILLLVRFV